MGLIIQPLLLGTFDNVPFWYVIMSLSLSLLKEIGQPEAQGGRMSVSGQSRKNNLAAVETGSSPLSVGQLAVKGWRLFLLKTPGVRDCPVVVHDEGGSRASTGVPSGKHSGD